MIKKLLADGSFTDNRIVRLAPLAFLILVSWVRPAISFGAITYVQGNSATPQTSQTSVSVTFDSAQTAADLNVVVVGWNNSTATVSAVTDSRGNTYALAVGPTVQAPVASQSIYYAKNIAAAAAGANSVTVTFSGAAAFPDIRILEYKGADLNNPVDVTAANSGNSGTSNSGTATTTNATDLIFGANLVQTTTTGPGSGFTRRLLTSDGDIAEDRMVTAVGSYSATAPLSSGQWIMQMVAFRTPVSGGDTTPPSAPTNLSATANGTQINLSWAASSDNVGVTGYQVEKCQGAGCSNFAQIATPMATTYADTGLGAGTYSYRVRAADAAGNLSGYSNVVNGVVADTISPTAPSNLTATANGTQINLSWTASTDNVGVTAYRVERCQGAGCTTFAQIAAPTTTTYNDTGLTANTSYSYRIRATDSAGNVSSYSNIASATSASQSAAITYVQGNSATPQTSQSVVNVTFTAAQTVGDLDVVVIGWNNSTATVSGVTDSRGNTYALAVGPTIQAPVASQSIYYAKNIAAAAAGANSVTVTFSGAAAFPDIRILEYKGADLNNPVDVTAANSGNSGTSNSGTATTTNATDLIFGANLVQTTTTGPGSGFTRRLLTSDGDIAEDRMVTAVGSYSATAPLSSGQWIMQMVAFRTPVSGGDTTPPSAPTNLSATANGTQINLSWAASSDNVGVTGYQVEKCQGAGCSNFAQIATPMATTYADTGLGAGTYSYRVRAADAAGNLSQYSNIGTASITGSVGTPTAPGNLIAGAGPAPIVVATQGYINATFLTSHTTAAFDSTGGDLIVLCASAHSGVTFTPSDSFGNTWIPIAGPTNANAGAFDLRTQLWYARNPAVGQGHTVTMGLSAAQPLVISIIVAKGSNLTSPIDAVSLIGSDNGTQTTAVVSPSVTTTASNDLLIGFAKVSAGASFAAGSGFTQQGTASSNFLDAETGPAATPGTYTATLTLNTSQSWQSAVVAAANNPNQASLSWTAATESGGTISNYLVERCQGVGCTNFAQIGPTTVAGFNDTGLSPSTSYSYRVRAEDTTNTVGPYSTVATLVTPGTTTSAPSAPGSLSASGPIVVATQGYINGTSLTSHTTAAFDSTGGDLIVMCASASAGVTFTPSDSFGNIWIPLAGPTSSTTGSDLRTQLWYAQNPVVGPGHTIAMGLSAAEPLVISILVAKGSNITSPIDAASLIGSDNGTQTTAVASPGATTTGKQ